MLKLLQWIYRLGYDKGYSDAVKSNRLNHKLNNVKTDEEFFNEIDHLMEEA